MKKFQFNSTSHKHTHQQHTTKGLFRIQILKKSKVPSFGPLRDGMVITRALLGPLVRLTALNANRAIRYSQQGYGRPYPTRAKYINDIISRHSKVLAPSEFLGMYFPGTPSDQSAASSSGSGTSGRVSPSMRKTQT